jgi:hypothetical protein
MNLAYCLKQLEAFATMAGRNAEADQAYLMRTVVTIPPIRIWPSGCAR